jgi:hypothetical protein
LGLERGPCLMIRRLRACDITPPGDLAD